MKLERWPFLLGLTLVLAGRAESVQVRGGVTLNDGSTGTSGLFRSPGDAQAFKDDGTPDFLYPMTVKHVIGSPEGGGELPGGGIMPTVFFGSYSRIIQGTPTLGLCYVGRLTINLLDGMWTSAPPLCFRPRPNPIQVCPEVCASDPELCTPAENQTCDSPIVVNMDGRGFAFCGPDDPVSFDLDSDGSPELITWTRRGSGDAFLVLDVDGDGRVDDGRELFGNYTLLPDGRMAGNGYLALAQYDALEQGGNADGVIDRLDAVFSRLKLWVDANHDGIAQAAELTSLEEAGLVRIDLAYHRSMRRDRYGNRLRYMSDAWILKGDREIRVSTTDVFFIRVR